MNRQKRRQKPTVNTTLSPEAIAIYREQRVAASLAQLDLVTGAIVRIVGREKVQAEIDTILSEISTGNATNAPKARKNG